MEFWLWRDSGLHNQMAVYEMVDLEIKSNMSKVKENHRRVQQPGLSHVTFAFYSFNHIK